MRIPRGRVTARTAGMYWGLSHWGDYIRGQTRRTAPTDIMGDFLRLKRGVQDHRTGLHFVQALRGGLPIDRRLHDGL